MAILPYMSSPVRVPLSSLTGWALLLEPAKDFLHGLNHPLPPRRKGPVRDMTPTAGKRQPALPAPYGPAGRRRGRRRRGAGARKSETRSALGSPSESAAKRWRADPRREKSDGEREPVGVEMGDGRYAAGDPRDGKNRYRCASCGGDRRFGGLRRLLVAAVRTRLAGGSRGL